MLENGKAIVEINAGRSSVMEVLNLSVSPRPLVLHMSTAIDSNFKGEGNQFLSSLKKLKSPKVAVENQLCLS